MRPAISFTYLSVSLLILLGIFGMTPAAEANELGNPSFESSLGGSGNWDNTANRGITLVTGAADAPNGSSYLRLREAGIGGGESFTFTFQTVLSEVHPGDVVAASGYLRQAPDDGNDEAQIRVEFHEANGSIISDDIVGLTAGATVSTFTRVFTNAKAPAGTTEVVVTLRFQNGEAGTGTADFDAIELTINGYPIDLDVEVTKNHVAKGSFAVATVVLDNVTADTSNANTELVVNVPNGLNLLDEGIRLNGQIATPERVGSEWFFRIGAFGPHDTRTLSFLTVVSPGAIIGHRYTITLFARDSTVPSLILSQTRSIPITIIADPLFDEGTVIGKVFDDQNENKIQDDGEKGISGARLATEEGIVIKTDKDGKYHVPGVQPGRHLVKIDGHSLPPGTKFITEESYLVKMTEGLLSKVDFAVKLPASKISEDYQNRFNVTVSQGNDFSRPLLRMRMSPDVLRIGQGLLEKTPMFSIQTNYSNMIANWKIEVLDDMGKEVWTGYGLGAPPEQAPWNGTAKNRKVIEPGIYAYRLIVRDSKSREDWTPLGFFKAVSKLNGEDENVKIEVPAAGFANIHRDGKRSIPIVAKQTLLVRGHAEPNSEVSLNGKSVWLNSDGSFESEMFVDSGKQPVVVRAKTAGGKAMTYHEEVDVKDTSFFMVALGEEELGVGRTDGNLETVGRDDRFHQGFYQTGKMAYYLKGKVKGKFLVTSRYDTASPLRQQLFTNLDPDLYYPVYGDDSEINYDARDTQERLFVLVEMDKSYAKYGSFQTNFNETELATYNRALSGLKVHHEVLSTTKYGDSKRGFTVFASKAKSLADHNEFLGTAGSLYYLHNKDVIEGSEQVRIEVRNETQGITVLRKELTAVTDYEIDYHQGRVLLRKPLSSISYSDWIVSGEILNGNQVYLVVDYEFEAQDLFGDKPQGVRGYTYLGDHLRLGGTAVTERRQDRDYDLRGIDALLKLGRNTKVSAEYAHSQYAQTRNAVSYNGGITFKSIPTGVKRVKKSSELIDGAWSIRAESQPIKGTQISGYAQQLNQGFSNADSISQKGAAKAGLELRQQLAKNTTASYRYDRIHEGELAATPSTAVHALQTKYDDGKYLGIAEYRHSEFDISPGESKRGFEPVFEREEFNNGFGTKLGYRLENGWLPYFKGQVTEGGKPNHQIGGGIEASILNKGTLRYEQMVGSLGESATLAFDRQVDERTSVYNQIKTGQGADDLGRGISTTIGSSYQVNGDSRLYTERESSTYERGAKTGDIAGYDIRLSDKWNFDISGERSRIRDFKDETGIKDHPDVAQGFYNVERTAGAIELSYLDPELLKIINRLESRFDRGNLRRRQWVSSHSAEWKINPDYTFSARANKSITRRTSGGGNDDGDFIELNTGVAYRPVSHNRLGILTRYTWLRDIGLIGQFETDDHVGIQADEASQIFGIEGAYDLTSWLGLVQKFGYKMGQLRTYSLPEWVTIGTYLSVTRLNFHITRKWDIAAEYRIRLDHRALDTSQQGLLFEIDREFYNYVRLGMGYNFTDFSDDLRQSNSYDHHGWFTRIT